MPTARPVYCFGDVHAAKAAPSSAHSNVEPDSFEENERIALVFWVEAGGPESIAVSGGVRSTIVQA